MATQAPLAHGSGAPASIDSSRSATPLHTQTQSQLAPTSDFWRNIQTALFARYSMRGATALAFNDIEKRPAGLPRKVLDILGKPGDLFHKKYGWKRNYAEAAIYNASLGIGSFLLTTSYSLSVYKDIKNIFSETVGEELGKPADQVNFADISKSDNRIIKATVSNFWHKLASRLATDALFIPASFMRNTAAADFVLGIKGVQLFVDTWKRKPTMFEDLVTFINNKINPRNGLGQPISMGEVFDLYQHYSDGFAKDRMFTNVLERGTGEGARWAQSQPIFERITQLMNLTYAYKHSSMLDPKTGHAIHQADFTLPKLIYLLGHDLIDVNKPEQTLTTIEVANRFGIPAVKQMRGMLADGFGLAEVKARFPAAAIPVPEKKAEPASEKNGVIAKGSTRQLDAAEGAVPDTRVHVESLVNQQTLGAAPQVNRAPV